MGNSVELAELDQGALRKWSAVEPFRDVLEHIRSRERGRSETSIDRFMQWLKQVDESYNTRAKALELMRWLEAAGAGEVILGRAGRKTRFRWFADMREVAELALSASDSTSTRSARPNDKAPEIEMMQLPFPLRPQLTVEFNLPRDLTNEEADRLARWIRALPIGSVTERELA